jgi:hypothetical protein
VPLSGDIRTVLLRGVQGLFLRVKSSWRSVFHMPRWAVNLAIETIPPQPTGLPANTGANHGGKV